MRHIDFRAMNCDMSVVMDTDSTVFDALLQQVPVWFEDWEQTFSRFRNDSELSQLNASAGRWFVASEDLWTMVHQSVQVARAHNGLVTPTILDALMNVGYDQSFEQMDQRTKPARAVSRVGGVSGLDAWAGIEFDAQARAVFLPSGIHLDLGGFVKGWCADEVVQRLAQFAPVLMDAGGDIAISGAMTDGGAWPIGIADPMDAEHDLAQVMVKRSGVATSGRDYRQWSQDGVVRHHIIDPRTGSSAQTDVLSASVIAPTAQQAELASKMLLILGAQAGMKWADEQKDYGACVVLDDGEVRMNERFKQSMWKTPNAAQCNDNQ